MITNFNTNLQVVSFEFVRKNGAVLTGSSTYFSQKRTPKKAKNSKIEHLV